MRIITILILLGSLTACVSATGEKQNAPAASTPSSTAKSSAPAFDDIPGFGRTPDSVLRDETIALWEAWRRQKVIGACMRQAGFNYETDFQYPDAEVLAVKRALGLPGGPPSDGSAKNAAIRKGLSRGRLSGYYQALYGLTLEQVEAEKGDSRGGCTGRAWASVESVWAARDALAAEMVALNKQLQADETVVGDAREEFNLCATEHGLTDVFSPADVDVSSAAPETQAAVLSACSDAYNASIEAARAELAQQFEAEHPRLKEHREKYAGAFERAKSDRGFLQDLQQ